MSGPRLGGGAAGGLIPVNITPPVITPGVPVNTAVPTISGTANQGNTLTAANGSWTNSPTSYAYQWQTSSNGGSTWSNIGAATAQTYTCVAGDVGNVLRVQVTATNATGASNPASSAQTATVGAAVTLTFPHSSTPAIATSATGAASITSPSFSPPANALILVFVGSLANSNSTEIVSGLTDSLGAHLTYSEQTEKAQGGDAYGSIWSATTGGAPGAMTITANFARTPQFGQYLAVIVCTASSGVPSIGAIATPIATTSGTPSISLTTTAANSQVVALVSNWSNATAPTVPGGQTTTFNGNSFQFLNGAHGDGVWVQALSSPAGSQGSQTINDTAPTAIEFAMVAVEVKA